MMRKFVTLLLFISTFGILHAKVDGDIILTIDDKQISKEEFIRIYEKNNNNLFDESERKTPKEYMELFINFKLKVIEAENLKLDTAKAFIDELAGYRKELAAPYLTDVSYNEKLIEETYERMKSEVKASHILVRLKNQEDTLDTYNKILKIRDEIIRGRSFEDAATHYSEDPSARTNKGSLGYFSAFQMVYPFEEAAYKTPVGEISQPVRTSFGYHLLKIEDKRPAKGELKVAHIMKMFPQDATDSVKEQLKTQIDSLYTLIQQGADFAELAKKASDDKRSSAQGGEMPWFNSARMIPEFAEPAFALKENGDISKPILSPYGYHIIKRINHKPVAAFEDVKSDIENRIKKDPERSKHNQEIFINKLKKEYNFNIIEPNKNDIINSLEGLINSSEANKDQLLDKEKLNATLFELNGVQFKADSFNDYLKSDLKDNTGNKPVNISEKFDEWTDKSILDYEDSMLEEKYPDFKYLMQEYHDGILLFNLSDSKIWSYAMKDSTGLQNFYEKNKGKYSWGERFKGMIIKCNDLAAREEVDKYLEENIPINEILEIINKGGEKVKIEEGAWEQGANPIVDYYVWNKEKPKNLNEGLEFIRGNKIAPEPKTLEDARGLYMSDYQNYLEQEWIKELRSKYSININKKVLKSI